MPAMAEATLRHLTATWKLGLNGNNLQKDCLKLSRVLYVVVSTDVGHRIID